MRQVLVPPDQVLQGHVELVLGHLLHVQLDQVPLVLLQPNVVLQEVSPQSAAVLQAPFQPVPFGLLASKSLVPARQVLLQPDLFDLPALKSPSAFALLAVSLGIDHPF